MSVFINVCTGITKYTTSSAVFLCYFATVLLLDCGVGVVFTINRCFYIVNIHISYSTTSSVHPDSVPIRFSLERYLVRVMW